jgi:hypothetical protein
MHCQQKELAMQMKTRPEWAWLDLARVCSAESLEHCPSAAPVPNKLLMTPWRISGWTSLYSKRMLQMQLKLLLVCPKGMLHHQLGQAVHWVSTWKQIDTRQPDLYMTGISCKVPKRDLLLWFFAATTYGLQHSKTL